MINSKAFKKCLLLGTTCMMLALPSVSYAATTITYGTTGWVQSGSAWKYIDANGTAAVDGWKEIDGKRYYFNSSGDMLTDTLVNDDGEYYYVTSDGTMIKNQWRLINNNGKGWYYFGSTGQACRNKNTRLTINDFTLIDGKKYAFSSTGKMLTGWISASSPDSTSQWYEADFYIDKDGIIAEGWQKLTVKPYNKSGKSSNSNEVDYWFYFDKGQKVTDSSRYIDDRMYAFDTTDGHMLVDWLAVNSDGTAVVFNPENTQAVSNAANQDEAKNKNDDGTPYVPANRETTTEKYVVPDSELVKKKITITSSDD